MLYLQLYLDEYRYILSTSNVVEIVPGVKLTPIPKVPSYISGICNYRGSSVPVIDLCELFLNRPSKKKLSSRIVFVNVSRSENRKKIVGFLVEKATETIKLDEDSFVSSGVYNKDLPFTGPVVSDKQGLITRILPEEIFNEIDSDLLFSNG